MKYIDLFAGVGGFHYGIDRSNWRVTSSPDTSDGREQSNLDSSNGDGRGSDTLTCVYSNEWDKYANSVYRRHYGECDDRDIRTVREDEIPSFDLLCAGFPCQAFSVAGKRKGFEDTRGTLFFEIARIAKYHQPKFMVLENVKGLISHDKGKTLEVILESLQELGYFVNWEVYNSKDYGVPQNRERIIFICSHVRNLLNAGQNKRITTSEQIIQDYLFQLLLNNLGEVRKLQGLGSKDSVVGWLLLNEMSRNLKSSESTTRDGISMDLVGKSSLLEERVWQNIDSWLKKTWEESYLGANKYTISTVISEITGWKTYTYSQMFLAICTLTAHLRNSSKSLWSEILSNLTVIREGTKYARLNNQEQAAIISEDGTAYLAIDPQENDQDDSLGHLRGTPRPKVFPIGNSNPKTLRQLNGPASQGNRVYDPEGISTTLASQAGGLGAKTGLYTVKVAYQDGKRGLGIRETDLANTLTATSYKGVDAANRNVVTHTLDANYYKGLMANQARTGVYDGVKIRRLTPTECERLQGFPDGWTAIDADGKPVSDTQRYKMMGNAVTANVVTVVVSRLLSGVADGEGEKE